MGNVGKRREREEGKRRGMRRWHNVKKCGEEKSDRTQKENKNRGKK